MLATTVSITQVHGSVGGIDMCEFAIHDKPNAGLIMCGPLNKLCTMCFMGNLNQYIECCKITNAQYYHIIKDGVKSESRRNCKY